MRLVISYHLTMTELY